MAVTRRNRRCFRVCGWGGEGVFWWSVVVEGPGGKGCGHAHEDGLWRKSTPVSLGPEALRDRRSGSWVVTRNISKIQCVTCAWCLGFFKHVAICHLHWAPSWCGAEWCWHLG